MTLGDGTAGDETVVAASADLGSVAPEVLELRPDYRALLLTVDGLIPGPGDAMSEALLTRAEEFARAALAESAVEDLPHVAAWREAYRAFDAKPQRTRNSLEALTRRAPAGLPRINRLTDTYNAISVLHQVPIGGEDLDRYVGVPRLVRASGEEPFDTTAEGVGVMEHPEPGEVVWRDDEGVTCRRWNWRQARRTQLSESTTRALFIIDALDPCTDEELATVADELVAHLSTSGAELTVRRQLLGRPSG
ncbi:B3/B4 domain-containing protein [Ornithinimicrobium cryptoxanthini]|uniref:B3/B4 domain-containing protein n=1 Tax=Ornithinimicrobium cryptoxanthini TaxID=2934161 RepID=UPI00351C60EA